MLLPQFSWLFFRKVSQSMINTILDAIKYDLETEGEPQSPYWLSSQMDEMRLWKASEHDVRAALDKDITEFGERSQFVETSDNEYALRSWAEERC